MSQVQPNSKIDKRQIAFVHVGKTGGTTVAWMIRKKCFLRHACNETLKIFNETEISLQTEDYFHTRKPQMDAFTSFIVTTRNPVERAVSWFLFRHPKNFFGNYDPIREKLFECYDQVNDLTTIGLALPVKGGENECENFAKACIGGKSEHCDHMRWNYEFYTLEILDKREKEIFVLRAEALWEDWQKINTMLGGGPVTRTRAVTHYKQGKNRIVFNRTMSEEGMHNLCRVLCSEIQLYKKLISSATNLNVTERAETLKDLWDKCPNEATSSKCNEEARLSQGNLLGKKE